MRLYTVGHSNRSAAALIDLLAEHAIALLVDVRSFPGSRRNPQFNRQRLAASLEEAGIGYRHRPALGGRRKPAPDSVNQGWKSAGFRAYADHMRTPGFAAALESLLQTAAERPTAVMCAEALPWRCHRWLIADAAVARGVDVLHLIDTDEARPHSLTSFAEIGADGRLSYPFTLTGT